MAAEVDQEIMRILKESYEEAKRLLVENREALDKIAECAVKADIIVYALSFMVDGLQDVDLSGKIIFEANYAHPVLAPQCGVESGCYLEGRLWLYHQAVPAFELFVGKTPDLLAMRKIMGIE